MIYRPAFVLTAPLPTVLLVLCMMSLASPCALTNPHYTLLRTVPQNAHDGVYDDSLQASDDTSIRSSVKGGYMSILLLFLLAVLIACMNHVLFSHLDGTEPRSHTSQFWVTVLKNVFPTTVSFLLFVNLKNCLLQVVRSLVNACLITGLTP